MNQRQEIEQKAEILAKQIQEHIKKLNQCFELIKPMCDKLGYAICEKTGELIKR